MATNWKFLTEREQTSYNLKSNGASTNSTFEDGVPLVAARMIWLVMSPVLIVVGTLGNVLSALVFCRKPLRNMAASLYLTVLAVADTSVLLYGLLFQWLQLSFEIAVSRRSNVGCKILTFLLYGSVQMEAWILVSVTIERFMTLTRLMTTQVWFTRRRACIGTCCLFTLIFAINCHFFATVHLDATNESPGRCRCKDEYQTFCTWMLPWIDAFLVSILPFVIMFTLNLIIIVKLREHNRFQKKYSDQGNQRGLEATPNVNSITAMLLCVTFIFILTTLPLLLFEALPQHIHDSIKPTDSVLIQTVCYMLSYVNCAINFQLYCVTSRKFRIELMRMCKVWNRRLIKYCRRNRVRPF